MLLEVRSVSVAFGGLKALDDVSFSLDEGDVLGVIGPNGAGKTTLLNVISAHIAPNSGDVVFDGVSIKNVAPHVVARRRLARSFQDTQAFPSLSVHETFIAGALHGRSLTQARKEADRLVEMLGLVSKVNKPQGSLSLPDRKLVEFGKCMAMKPKLMLLDEVMAGLTMGEAEGPLELIQDLREKDGVSFVLIEHVMPVVMRVASRLVVLDFGQLIVDGGPAEVVADQRVRASYLGGK